MLDTPDETGATQRDHLMAVAKIPNAPRPPELDAPVEPPPTFLFAWSVFNHLNAARHYTDRGNPLPITHQEILAWCELMGERLTRSDLQVIRVSDRVWINSRYELARAS